MKHCKGILAGLSLVMAMPTMAYGAAAQPAKVSLEINGTDQTLQSVCNIGGNTYFQLRELASLMSKEMPFDVGWDASAQTILPAPYRFSSVSDCNAPMGISNQLPSFTAR